MIRRLKAVAAFWYDFVVGDDWRVALGVAAAMALTYGTAKSSVPVWWLLPVAVVLVLVVSVRRAVRAR